MDQSISQIVLEWINQFEIAIPYNFYIRNAILVVSVVILSILAHLITKKIILNVIHKVAKKTKTNWDDILLEKKVFHKIAHFAPAVVIYFLATIALESFPSLIILTQAAAKVYLIITILMAISAFLNALHSIYLTYPIAKYKPIKGYIQLVKIIFFSVGAILIISVLIGKSPAFLLGGLGALTAVLMLVFKDTILGLVASIQLTANDMVRPGDWVSMSKYGADGNVLEISLTSVKVQNFDKTVTTIPTYAMISESFQNWRAMEEGSGRRIKRSLNIDLNSIKFIEKEDLAKFKKYRLLRDYVEKKETELKEFNKKNDLDENVIGNSRRQTNIGVFRAYLEAYLRDNPNINTKLTFLIRQLQPTENGVAIEIYVFSKIKAWVEYESVQSNIFDHLFAIIPEFGLRLYQYPSGGDFVLKKK
jgi:miniconductance mechanosensitive channel